MALKTILDEDQLGELDESTRDFYAQTDDGNYVLDVEGIDEHPTVQALKSGHKRSKDERKAAQQKADEMRRKLGALADEDDVDLSDVDPERLQQLRPYLTGESELPKEGGKPDVDVDKIKDNARKPLQRDLESAQAERDQYKQQLHSLVVDNALTNAISEVKVHGPYAKAVKSMFRDQVKIGEDDNGNPTAMIDGEYGEQPVAKYMKDWATSDEGKAFIEAPQNGGGGARGGSTSAKAKNPWSPDHWNMGEQTRVYREDPEKAKRMAAEHGKRVG